MTLARVTTWIDGNTLTAAALNGEFDNIINNPASLFSVPTDRLLGRDAAGTGNVENISVTNGLAFTGSTSIGIANDGVTYARMQNVTAASRLLGRGSAAGAGDPEELAVSSGLQFSGTTLLATGRDTMQFWSTTTVLAGVTTFLGRGDSTVSEATVCFPVPYTGVVLALHSLGAGAAAGAGETWTYTLRAGLADTALTHAVTGAATFQGSSSGSIAVTAGDILSIKLVTSASAGVAVHMCSISILGS